MDEIIELGRHLRRSKESVEPPKGVTTWLVLEVIVVLAAVFVLVIFFAFARGATSAGVSLGMSMAMYLLTRAAALAGIPAFLHFGMRSCLAGIDSSRGWVQRMGWGALTLTVPVLALAAFLILIFFSIADY
jgi:hypothetical protein